MGFQGFILITQKYVITFPFDQAEAITSFFHFRLIFVFSHVPHP